MKELISTFNLLRKKFPGYEGRPQQIEMATEVFRCLNDKKRILIEAGTGVGKSFAYLIPAILSEEKTIISTASIALQDQLVKKDLVFLHKTLPQKFSFTILKGKNNYLCLKRDMEFAGFGESYKRFKNWASNTKTGDKDELPFIPDFWVRVCCDTDDCSVKGCPFFYKCFYYRHYRELSKKDILVVNHYLLVYDILSEFNLIPFHKQLIIDEAHQIENVISHVLGSTLSHSRVVWLLYRLRGLKVAVDHLFEPVDLLFKGKDVPSRPAYPIPYTKIEELRNLRKTLALDKVVTQLNDYKEPATDTKLKDRAETTITYVKSLACDIDDFIEKADNNRVYYMTGNKGYLEFKSSLVESQKPFTKLVMSYDSLVMTSATLRTVEGFDYLNKRLGITDFKEKSIGSPFNFRKQALLYIDKKLPNPNKENNETLWQKGLNVIEELISASSGRALILFTSYSHLHFVSKHISIDHPLKSQGDMPSARLIQWFKNMPDPVLLATATFWQGIDIKGDTLSLVIIVKIPFGTPGDPVYDERCKRLADRWFTDLALPSAILLLKQGFGRLIRGSDDHGVIAILDTRLMTKPYGKTIISSLPEMDVVHNVEHVKRFFDNIAQPATRKVPPIVTISQAKSINHSNNEKNNGISQLVALGNCNDPSVIPKLLDFTMSMNVNERRLAASALGKLARFKPAIYQAVERLEMLLDDEKPQVRQYALKALSRIDRVRQERLESIIANRGEKMYNISLAKSLLRKMIRNQG